MTNGRGEISEQAMVYIGRRPECGHIVAAVADLPGMRKLTAKDVSTMIKDGYSVHRIPTADLKGEGFCRCERGALRKRGIEGGVQ